MNSKKANLAFISRCIGVNSEVWMWRQLKSFKKLEPNIITWNYINSEYFNISGIPMQIIPFDPDDGNCAFLKWFRRTQGILDSNFYSSIGKEKQFIEKKILEMKVKVILCHFGHTALRILPIAENLRIPIVAHFHGLDLSSSLNNRWYRWSLLPALKKFSAIIVVGTRQKKWIINHGVEEKKVHLIPCGVPTDFFEYKIRKASNKIQFICVSRLVECKGLEYTIRAFAHVIKELKNARLIIIGDGPLKNDLKALSNELGIEKFITFTGSIFQDKVREYLFESDIFVQHSIIASNGSQEGFGVSLSEAASTGLPIISTRCGGISDQIINGETGFIVEQKDINAMADRMLKLACDSVLRVKMGRAGREHMVDNFDAYKQVAKLESVLLDCL